MSRSFSLVVLCALLVASCSESPRKHHKSVRVQFGWIPDVHHAGFWIAQEMGYFKEAGLDVTLLPGGLDSSPLKAVASGDVEIGQAGGLEQIISARAEGLPIRAIAAFHRTSPQALISLAENPITNASELRGKRVAVAYGDAAELLFKEFLNTHGLAQSDVHTVPFRFDLTPLMDHRVDAITGFSSDQPAILQVKGFSPVVLRYSNSGIVSYGYTFFTSDALLRQDPKLIEAFLEASRRGWEYTFKHDEEAIDLMIRTFPGLDPAVERLKFEKVRELMCTDGSNLSTWDLALSVVSGASARLTTYGSLIAPVAPESLVAPNAMLR